MLTFIAILTILLTLFDPSDCAATKVPGLYIGTIFFTQTK